MPVTRINDPSAIEARLLELAHTTDAKITAAALAYFAPCSIAAAQQVLDDLTTRSLLNMEVEDDGTIVYQMPGRQKMAPPPRKPAPILMPAVERSTALVPAQRGYPASPLLAALLTVFIPGAGHLYAGRFVAALLWFFVVGAGYALILPGLILHLFAIASAANAAHRLNAGPQRYQLTAGVY
jgi:TM2 domain-containing membrane protein YozV